MIGISTVVVQIMKLRELSMQQLIILIRKECQGIPDNARGWIMICAKMDA